MTQDKEEFSPGDVAKLLGNQPAASAPSQNNTMGRTAARAFLAAIDAIRERHRMRHELDVLAEDGDLDRVLAEAQLTRADIEPMIANLPASGHLLADMAARLRVEDELHHDRLAERVMGRVCTVCNEQRRCRHWLASGATQGYTDFCPNAEALDEMRRAMK